MHALSKEEISRYSRQLILPEIGVSGQERLKRGRVLIVGCGGLGCPLAIYLAAAGVGHLGLVDYDVVEESNLHRQVAHGEDGVGTSKAKSIAAAVKRLNSSVECKEFTVLLNSANGLSIVNEYDVIADCTDNVATRYLLNDASVLNGKPLVSGSALRWEGQLTVYNHQNGPCYRCIFPRPPPPETVTNCSDGGVLGAVPGMIGTMQAVEVVKILTGIPSSYAGKLFMFDGLAGETRKIGLRKKQDSCVVCGSSPSVTKLIDYTEFCGSGPNDKTCSISKLSKEDRISVFDLRESLSSKTDHSAIYIDVRPQHEFQICALPKFMNIPITKLKSESMTALNAVELMGEEAMENGGISRAVLICHNGNDSQIAVLSLRKLLGPNVDVKDVVGGLSKWSLEIDNEFPVY